MICPYCGAKAVLRSAEIVYPSTGDRYGIVFVCANYPPCDAYVGVHSGTRKAKGTLANAELREWRKKAHAAFDELWRGPKSHMSRSGAYRFLQVGLRAKGAIHIGESDIARCQEIVRLVMAYRRIA